MAGSPRERAKAERRERYLAAAATLIAERGYSGVSIDLLGAAVGVSGPALYRYFSGKEDILTQLLVGASERLLAGSQAIIAAGAAGAADADADTAADAATLDALIRFHLDFATTERDVILAQERELVHLPEAPQRLVRQLQRRYVRGWEEVAARLAPAVAPAELTLRLHAVFGLLNSTPYSGTHAAPERVRDVLAAMARAALFAR